MSFSEKLNQSIQYTGSIFKRLGDLLILFILSIIPIVNLMALGYYARIVRESPASIMVPKLERYGDLFVEGLKIVVVGIIWTIIIASLAVIIAIPFFAVAAIGNLFTNPGNLFTAGWIFAFGSFFVIFGIIAFFIGIFAFMGIVHMVKTNQFSKAFAFGEILRMIGKIGWLRYLAFFVVVFIVSTILGVITGALGPIGWVIGSLLSVLAGIVFARTIGLLYDQASGALPPVVPAATA